MAILVRASEPHSPIAGLDTAFLVHHLLKEISDNLIPIAALVHSRTVFEVLAKQGRTTDKRIQIDIY